MVKILCRTKGNADPHGKPRVYFTCHPEDFDRYFDKICEDIFKTRDVAIFYTEDMTEAIPEQDRETYLNSNNLFVVPITFRLLSQPNRAMDSDIAYALEKGIPLAPFMMETGISEFYGKKFGKRQYLSPYSTDTTEISYEEKLKKYLENTLISDELARRIRAAFDSYIFLSYRKKDRRYANELMKLIHSHPEFRDVAIWFDEFLTPGENFMENIQKALEKSKMFALLVTPNLLEEQDGIPNFVMGKVYPIACDMGKPILPVEMEQTDFAELSAKFKDIPTCVDPQNAEFKSRLLEHIAGCASDDNNDDLLHNYLIGLAYLEGVDVEIDRQRGMGMITYAAEMGVPEAMERLYSLYDERRDYRNQIIWAERLAEYHKAQNGEKHPGTLTALYNLSVTCYHLRDYQAAQKYASKAYLLRCRVLGRQHPDTVQSEKNLQAIWRTLGVCQNCGGAFNEDQVCTFCKNLKDY